MGYMVVSQKKCTYQLLLKYRTFSLKVYTLVSSVHNAEKYVHSRFLEVSNTNVGDLIILSSSSLLISPRNLMWSY